MRRTAVAVLWLASSTLPPAVAGGFPPSHPVSVPAEDPSSVRADNGIFICPPALPPGFATPDLDQEPATDIDHGQSALDPVFLFSGEFYEPATDLTIRGRGLDFQWRRTYRSKTGPSTAQGHGWDFSYNLRVQSSGEDLVLWQGNGRRDVFRPRSANTWARRELFQLLTRQADGSFILRFADSARWELLPLDGRPAEGRIARMVDRNGNQMTFDYDAQGRLAVIHDSLDTAAHRRDIHIGYDLNGRITSVTDFLGRSVTYTYYGSSDPPGSPGDLRSVTTPAVTGSCNGNDFPLGKTVVYTYTRGFSDDSLNHNLLTITDPKGQTYLRNIYAHTTDPADVRHTEDPADLNFNRLVSQIWGGPDDRIEITYEALIPAPEEGFAVLRATVNDRVGNVRELSYDAGNRLVRLRFHTARAIAGQPVTATTNRPRFPVRASDSPFFDTHIEYNADSLPIRILHPNGNEETFTYDERNRSRFAQGNLLRSCALPGPLGGDQAEICETFEHDPRFGNTFITRHIDRRGHLTASTFDDHGNLVQRTHRLPTIVEDFEFNEHGQVTVHVAPDHDGSGIRQRDERRYFTEADGAANGYLAEETTGVGTSCARTTRYEVDAVGNILRRIDSRGKDRLYVYNQQDQLVCERSEEVETLGGPRRYDRSIFYDANDNQVRIDLQQVNDQGETPSDAVITTRFEYEILNYMTEKGEEIGEGREAVTAYTYDANRQLVVVRYGEAMNGNQRDNGEAYAYDALKRPFRRTYGLGEGGLIEQYDYDGNGNRIRTISDVGTADSRITLESYDGYNRNTATRTPMGNIGKQSYDPNGRVVRLRVEGPLIDDSPGEDSNVRLLEETYEYDDMNRLTRESVSLFDPATQNPLPGNPVAASYEYTNTSRIRRIVDENGHETLYSYDSCDDLRQIRDAADNLVRFDYDANRNLIRRSEIEHLAKSDETFVTSYTYDALDRLVSTVDSAGNTTTYAYDSRDNRTRIVDAAGNEQRLSYDGMDRLVETRWRPAPGQAGAEIVTRQEWDDSSRLVAQIDANGNRTASAYDGQGRLIVVVFADGTLATYEFNLHGNVIRAVDPNGTEKHYTYDRDDRLIGRRAVPASGVLGTTSETFAYDGMSRIVSARDDDSLVERTYDSLGRVVRESLEGQATAVAYDPVGNAVTLTYPSGRTVHATYDAVNRKETISGDRGTLATYEWAGPGRVARRELGNGTETLFTWDGTANQPGDFGVRKPVRILHRRAGTGVVIDDRTWAWDRTGNRVRRTDLATGLPPTANDYSYDLLYRLTGSRQSSPAGASTITYDLDPAGNRRSVTGGPHQGPYRLSDSGPEPADRQLNQYTEIPGERRTYDRNGNLVRIDSGSGARLLSYDYRNHLVRYEDAASRRVTTFDYDALGRRIRKQTSRNGSLERTAQYFYDGWNLIEEQGSTPATFVHGASLDEVVQMETPAGSFFLHGDDLQSVVAATDATGRVVERYAYRDFGEPLIYDPTGRSRTASAIGNPHLFTGRRWDPESGLYELRTRYLDPVAGRFLTRDTLGMWADPTALGNGYTYAGNNPWTMTDPTGQWVEPQFKPLTGCTEERQAVVRAALDEAERIARGARRYVEDMEDSRGRSCDLRYFTWFGLFQRRRFDQVFRYFHLIERSITVDPLSFDCSKTDCDAGDIAFVRPSNPLDTYIHLCNPFWSRSKSGPKSQGGTILHEVSHQVANTDDAQYGPMLCRQLAQRKPGRAINNADSYALFAENSPPIRGCDPVTAPISVVSDLVDVQGAVVTAVFREIDRFVGTPKLSGAAAVLALWLIGWAWWSWRR